MKFKSEVVENANGQQMFRVEIRNAQGAVMSKNLSIEDYLHLLESSLNLDMIEDVIRVPAYHLPDGYIDGKFSRSGYTMVWREKAKKRLFVHKTGHYQIPFPDLIFVLSVKDGKTLRKSVYSAVKDTLYRYPFGNVDSDGNICMGNIRADLSRAKHFSEDFFLGKTNDDYYAPGDSVKPKWTQGKLLEEAAKHETFPLRWLSKDTRYKTVGSLVKAVMGGDVDEEVSYV